MSRPLTRASSECVAAIAALPARVSLCVLIGERNDALLCRSTVGKRQAGPIAPIFEEAFPPTEEDWMEHEPKFVDQLVLHECLDEFSTAIDQDVLPGLLLEARTASSASPASSAAFHSSGSFNVVDATYLGRLFIRSAKPCSSVTDGQTAAKLSYVTRPSSSASLAKSWSYCIFCSSSFQ